MTEPGADRSGAGPVGLEGVEQEVLARLLTTPAAAGEVLRYGRHPDQVAETFGPVDDPVDGPVVVVVHGGYFRPGIDRTHARAQAHALAAVGHRVVVAEYRRTPGRPEHAVEDLWRLDAAVRECSMTPAAWVGHSAGGTLVLLRALAADLPPVPVLSLAPVADLTAAAREGAGDGAVPAWLGGLPEDVPARYARFDPQLRLSRNDGVDGGASVVPELAAPVTVLHGESDATVPVAQTEELPDVAGLRRRVLPGAHHFDLIDPDSSFWPAVLTELRQLTGA